MKMKRLSAFVILALLLSLMLAACGGEAQEPAVEEAAPAEEAAPQEEAAPAEEAAPQEEAAALPQGQFDHPAATDASEPRLERRFRSRQAQQRAQLQDAHRAG